MVSGIEIVFLSPVGKSGLNNRSYNPILLRSNAETSNSHLFFPPVINSTSTISFLVFFKACKKIFVSVSTMFDELSFDVTLPENESVLY